MNINQNVLQWKFTSCQYNIENANGFKTYSMSEGLTVDDKEELIQIAGSYQCPNNLPDQPTSEELSLFPVTFVSVKLRSGKRALIQTTYVGQDYAGVRWGNFFSHALVLPSGEWEFYPVQMWNSPLFQPGLTPEEQNIGQMPPPLPPLQITDECLHDWTNDLQTFMADSNHLKITKELMKAIFEMKTQGKSLFLHDSHLVIPNWIAALQYAFPVSLAQDLFFTTNLQSLNNAQGIHINATSLDKNEFFYSSSQTAPFFVFDITQQKYPLIKSDLSAVFNLFNSNNGSYPGDFPKMINDLCHLWDCKFPDPSLNLAIQLEMFLTGRKFGAVTSQGMATSNNAASIASKDTPDYKAIFNFFSIQPEEKRIQGVRKLLVHPVRCPLEKLPDILPQIAKTVIESKDEKLKNDFCTFLIRKFSVSLDNLQKVDSEKYFKLIDDLFSDSSIQACRIPIIELLSKQDRAQQYNMDFLLFETSLRLMSKDDFCGEVKFLKEHRLGKLKDPEKKKEFLDYILRSAIKYCGKWKDHEALINLYPDRDADFYNKYLPILKKKYNTANWSNGRSADPIAIDFIKYFFKCLKNDANSHEVRWLRDGNLNNTLNSTPCMLKLFDLTGNNKVNQKRQIHNILIKDANLNKNESDLLYYYILKLPRPAKGHIEKIMDWITRSSIWEKVALAVAVVVLMILIGCLIKLSCRNTGNDKQATTSDTTAVASDSNPQGNNAKTPAENKQKPTQKQGN